MKSIFKYYGVFGLLGLSIVGVGCNNNPTSYQKTNDNKNSIASKMVLPKGTPKEVLNYTIEDYKGLVISEIPVLAKRMSTDGSVISMEELSEAIDVVDAKYPAFKDSLPEEVINRIRADFPGVSDEELGANAEEIVKLYEALKTYEVFQEIKEEAAINGLAKSQYNGYDDGYMFTPLNSQEFWLIMGNLKMKDGTEKASNEALQFARDLFSQDQARFGAGYLHLTRGDGFRHAVWNALIAKHTGEHHWTIGDAVAWAKKFTDAHENGASTQPTDPRDNAMDFHNNAEGRTYFKSVAIRKKVKDYWLFKWHYKYYVTAPATGTLKSDVYTKTLSGRVFSNNSQLPALGGNIVWIKN